MTLDELFEALKIKDTQETIESYNKGELAKLRQEFMRNKIEARANERNVQNFYQTLNGANYERQFHKGKPYIVNLVFEEDDKNEYLKNLFTQIFTKEEQKGIIDEASALSLDNLEHENIAPKELDQAIEKASEADKELLNEIKNVVFQSVNEKYRIYYTELQKRKESIHIKETDKLIKTILDNPKTEFAHAAGKILFDESGSIIDNALLDPTKDLSARKYIFNTMLNPKDMPTNTLEEKQMLKAVIKIVYDRLYDGKPIKGEESNKVYAARKFYSSYKKISDLAQNENIDIEAIRNEYENYKKLKNEFDSVITDVAKILNGKGYAGNMDLSRTQGMPDSFVKNIDTVSIINGIWVLIGYMNEHNLSVDDLLDNPFKDMSKLMHTEMDFDYNTKFSKANLADSLKLAMEFKNNSPVNYYSISRSLSNSLMLNDTNPEPKIYERLFSVQYMTMSHGLDLNYNTINTMTKIYLFGHPSEEIDYNYFFSSNYIDYDKMEIVDNSDKEKKNKILELEGKAHVGLDEIKNRLDFIKEVYKPYAGEYTLFDLTNIYNSYIHKYMASYSFDDLEMAAKIKEYLKTNNFNPKISTLNVIKNLADNAITEQNFTSLLNYAKEKAFKESPSDTLEIAKVLRDTLNKFSKDDELEKAMTDFELKANGEILFTAFNNQSLLNETQAQLNSYDRILEDLINSKNFDINKDLLKGIVLSKEFPSEANQKHLENALYEVVDAFKANTYSEYLDRYINYVNNDSRQLSSENKDDIKKALLMKNAYNNMKEISKNYPSYLLDKLNSNELKNEFNMNMNKLYEYQKLLNNDLDSISYLRSMLNNEQANNKISASIYNKDKNIATRAAVDFFTNIVETNTNHAEDLRLANAGFKGFDRLEFRIFIDGKSLNEICREKYPNMDINTAKGEVLLNALLNPTKPIELANYNNDYEVKAINIDFTDAKINSNYYSKLRRFFKAFAPLRPNHTYESALAKAEANSDERNKKIKGRYMEYVLASKMQTIQNEARKRIVVPKESLSESKNLSFDNTNTLNREKDLKK